MNNFIIQKNVFTLWMNGEMSLNRKKCLNSIYENIGCNVIHVNMDNINDYVVESHPIHRSFKYLSAVHKSDYLRCYLMHHWGGGYVDIKYLYKNWNIYFDMLECSDNYVLGYPEVCADAVAPVGGYIEHLLRENYNILIGMGAFIFKPYTKLTYEWYTKLNDILDFKYEMLMKYPANNARDFFGMNGSKYPILWTELLGNILHPIILNNSNKIMQCDISPEFTNYM